MRTLTPGKDASSDLSTASVPSNAQQNQARQLLRTLIAHRAACFCLSQLMRAPYVVCAELHAAVVGVHLRQARRMRDVHLAARLHQQQLHCCPAARLRQPPRARARRQRHLLRTEVPGSARLPTLQPRRLHTLLAGPSGNPYSAAQ